jgi:hypothetical protein
MKEIHLRFNEHVDKAALRPYLNRNYSNGALGLPRERGISAGRMKT